MKSIGRVYGEEILVDTNLPWISVVEPPGLIELLAPTDFKRRLEGREVFVVYGNKGGPWGSARLCQTCFLEIDQTALIVPVSTEGQPDVGSYNDKDGELIRARLPDHFGHSFSRGGYEKATLLQITLQLIASATNRSIDEITEMKWTRTERTICLRLSPSGA